jgi:hypothetical protein
MIHFVPDMFRSTTAIIRVYQVEGKGRKENKNKQQQHTTWLLCYKKYIFILKLQNRVFIYDSVILFITINGQQELHFLRLWLEPIFFIG